MMDKKNNSEITDTEIKAEVYEPTALEPKNRQQKSDTPYLYLVVITANILMFVKGTCAAWTSPVIPQLKSNNSEVNPLEEAITTVQISILFGVPELCVILGTLLFGKLPDIVGRKYTLVGISCLILLSNLTMVIFGSHVYVYIVGRCFQKLGLGLLTSALPIYLNEICEDHNRAKHGGLMMFFLPLGSLYAYLVGSVTNVRWFTLLCAVPLIPQILLLLVLVPESPIYSAAKGDEATTIKTLKELRSNKPEEEIVQDYLKIDATVRTRDESFRVGFQDLFETKSLRRGILVGLVVCLSTPVSGATDVMGYLAPIFNDANTNLSGNSVAILVGVVKLFSFFASFAAVERLGRRPLLLFSCSATAVTLAITAVYFYLNSTNAEIIQSIRWLPILCVLAYIACFSLGVGPIPISFLAVLFPDDARSTASSFVSTVVGIVSTIISTCFPLLVDHLGVHICLGMFSVGCVLIFVSMYFLLPETTGKSFSEIQDLLEK
ncbi:facilitated trehalose transporter Tret1 [Leptinotarsa decemlineata]|uniref:facilitated trehalose transporter Tret1 n=1 Tax=Leptinotarsa decemlineata TaxID=7539 RepID=UPI003D30C869